MIGRAVPSAYRVVPAASKRVTPEEPPERHRDPSVRAVLAQRILGVLRAGRRKAAGKRQMGRDRSSIYVQSREADLCQ